LGKKYKKYIFGATSIITQVCILLFCSGTMQSKAWASNENVELSQASSIDQEKNDFEDVEKKISEKGDFLQVPFIENQGQINSQAKFYADIFSGRFFVSEKNIVYTIKDINFNNNKISQQSAKDFQSAEKNQKEIAFYEEFLDKSGSVKDYKVSGEDASETRISVFGGNDEEKWKRDLSSYNVVNLGEVWEKINVHLRAYGKNVEKIFTVMPGGDPQNISMQFEGVEYIEKNIEERLIMHTELGDLSMTKPIAYQVDKKGNRQYVSVSYKILGNNRYAFSIGEYDDSLSLVIDPLLGSTYLGGADSEYFGAIGLDSSGNVFVTGMTASSDFPTTPGVFETDFHSGSGDVFISKFDRNLQSLTASTYVGGDGVDRPTTITFDGLQNVIVGGDTDSSDFPDPIVIGPAWPQYVTNAFVAKLSNDLSDLDDSTYLNGDSGGTSSIYGMETDPSGDLIACGKTDSADFPTTAGSFQETLAGGSDIFVTKLDAEDLSIAESTFVGAWNEESPKAIALDAVGNVFVVGTTQSYVYEIMDEYGDPFDPAQYSVPFPTTPGAYKTSMIDTSDYFIFRLNNNLSALDASTFFGAYGNLTSIDVSVSGDVFATGQVYDENFQATPGAFDTNNQSDIDDVQAIVIKMNSNLTNMAAATFLGGIGGLGNSVAVDSLGKVFVFGGQASGFPLTAGAYDNVYNANKELITKFDENLSTLEASTYFGGDGNAIYTPTLKLDSTGKVYVAGSYAESDWPMTDSSYDIAYDNSLDDYKYDIVVSRLDNNLSLDGAIDEDPVISPNNSVISASSTTAAVDNPVTIMITSKDTDGNLFTSGGESVTVSVTGAYNLSLAVTDNGDGTYFASFTPQNSGNFEIQGTMGGEAIGSDTDGVSDGLFHLTAVSRDNGDGDETAIYIGKNIFKKLSGGETVGAKAKNFSFRAIRGSSNIWGKISLLKDGTLIKRASVRANRPWKISVRSTSLLETHHYQVQYYDNKNNFIRLSENYLITFDRKNPQFTYLPKKISASAGSTISWQASDNDQIQNYQIIFQGKKYEMTNPQFTLPQNSSRGASRTTLKVFDRAGNKTMKKIKILVGN
jgi:hypothetical protein